MKVFFHLKDMLTFYSTARKALQPLLYNNLTAFDITTDDGEIPLTIKTLKQLSSILDDVGMLRLKDNDGNIIVIGRVHVQ